MTKYEEKINTLIEKQGIIANDIKHICKSKVQS